MMSGNGKLRKNQPRVSIIQDPAAEQSKEHAENLKIKAVDNSGNAALLALLKIESEARDAQTEPELVFLAANEIRKLTRARQVFVLREKSGLGFTVEGINSLDSVDRNSPLIRWVERMVRQLKKLDGLDGQRVFSLPAYCAASEEETRT